MPHPRRSVLAGLGAALFAAGCAGSPGGEGTSPTDPAPGDSTTTTGGTPPDTTTTRPPTPEDPITGRPPTPDGRFEAVPCPSFVETDRTVCWHTEADDPPVTLQPMSLEFVDREGDGAVQTTGFRLVNRSDRAFGFNPYAWRLNRFEDPGWTRVAPEEWIEPWETVPAGGDYHWAFSRQPHPSPNRPDTVQVVAEVGPGTYAFSVHGVLGEGEGDTAYESVALFDVAVAAPERAAPGTTPVATDRD